MVKVDIIGLGLLFSMVLMACSSASTQVSVTVCSARSVTNNLGGCRMDRLT